MFNLFGNGGENKAGSQPEKNLKLEVKEKFTEKNAEVIYSNYRFCVHGRFYFSA